MKVLMFSTDTKIFDEGTDVRQRMIDYGSLVDELYIMIPTWKKELEGEVKLSSNVRALGGHVTSRLKAVWQGQAQIVDFLKDRERKGERLDNWLITSQDCFEVGLVAIIAGWRLSLPVQLQIHTDFLNKHFYRQSFRNKVRTYLAGPLLRRAKCVRVVSNRIKNSIVRRYCVDSKKISVLPIRRDTKHYKEAEAKFDLHKKYGFDFVVLMASRLAPEKNIEMAIRAMKNVVAEHKRAGLVIVGEGSEEEKLKLLASSYQLSANVVFEPWTNELASYYKTCDIFLLTSNYEGYGMTLIEAAASGAAIVSTNVGLIGEELNETNVLVVPVGDDVTLVQSINTLIKNPGMRTLLSQRASAAIVDTSKQSYLEEYKSLWSLCLD